jgi:8-oxo-dGTP pyrophosphatase MutT (NUDIX family)
MQPVAAAAVIDDQRRVLMLWRHRFITGTWGWEIPTGIVDPGETSAHTAAREVEEETGWRPGPLTPLLSYEPTNGITDSRHHLYWANGATWQAPPSDTTEADRIEWVPLAEIRSLIDKGELTDGPTLIALLHILAFPPW